MGPVLLHLKLWVFGPMLQCCVVSVATLGHQQWPGLPLAHSTAQWGVVGAARCSLLGRNHC